MGLYDIYADRERNSLGVAIKKRQAKKIFHFGLPTDNRIVASVLEIGPGDGYIADLAKANGLDYLGMEGNFSIAHNLQARGHRIVNSVVPPLPTDIGKFDICYVLHVIEHMKDIDMAVNLIRGIREQLSCQGRLVIACPDYGRWKHYFYDCDYTHSLPFTRRRLSRLLTTEGFTVLKETTYVGHVFGYPGLMFSWLARLAYPQIVDEIAGSFVKNDLINRGFLTLLPNLFVVAEKDNSPTFHS